MGEGKKFSLQFTQKNPLLLEQSSTNLKGTKGEKNTLYKPCRDVPQRLQPVYKLTHWI